MHQTNLFHFNFYSGKKSLDFKEFFRNFHLNALLCTVLVQIITHNLEVRTNLIFSGMFCVDN